MLSSQCLHLLPPGGHLGINPERQLVLPTCSGSLPSGQPAFLEGSPGSWSQGSASGVSALPSLASRWKTSSPGAQQAPSAATSTKSVDARILRTECKPCLLPQTMTGLCVSGEWTQPDPAGSDEGATVSPLVVVVAPPSTPSSPLRQRYLELRSFTYSFLSAVIKRHLLCLFWGTERRRQGPLTESRGGDVLRGELFSFSEPCFSVWLL